MSQLVSYVPNTSTITTSGAGTNYPVYVWVNSTSASTSNSLTLTNCTFDDDVTLDVGLPDILNVPDGQARKIYLPDGTMIDVKADGSFEIKDEQAKVIYRANRIRDFNPFINASDKIEDFIGFCGQNGVRKGEMLELPLKLFIGWLCLEAAKADREPEPEVKLLPDLRKRVAPKCPACGRFTSQRLRAQRIEFCATSCFDKHFQRVVQALSLTQSMRDPVEDTGGSQ